jgi:hypothetical protein
MSAVSDESLPGRRVVDWVAAFLAGAGAVSGNPILIALGPLLQPALQTAFSVDEKAWRQRALRGARTLQVAAEELDISIDELGSQIGAGPEQAELLARVLEASARTLTLTAKVEALGRVLASGLKDEAKLDEAAMLAAALMDMEAPHVRVLTAIKTKSAAGSGASRDMLLREFAGLKFGLANIISVLSRHGLILQRSSVPNPNKARIIPGETRRAGDRGEGEVMDARDFDWETAEHRVVDASQIMGAQELYGANLESASRWLVSALGLECLELLGRPARD